jgi:hypothetical protein
VDADGNVYRQNDDPGAKMSWTGHWNALTSSGVSEIRPEYTEDIAWSWSAIANGNPSGTAVAAASVGSAERRKSWIVGALQRTGFMDSCPNKADDSSPAPLVGEPLARYRELKARLISWLQNLSSSSTCANFINTRPKFKGKQLTIAMVLDELAKQEPMDGRLSTSNQFDSGLYFDWELNAGRKKSLLTAPVCAILRGQPGTTGFSPTAGQSPSYVFINTNGWKQTVTQQEIFHEALHRLTGLADFLATTVQQKYNVPAPYDLKTFVGIEVQRGVDPGKDGLTVDISNQIKNQGCVASE